MAKEVIWQDRKRHLGLPISFTKYQLSTDRLFITTGFLNTTENEVRLYRISDVSLTRSLFQKLFGVGTIKVYSSDKSLHDFYIVNVSHSDHVKELLSQQVEEERKRNRVYTRENMVSGSGVEEDFDGDGIPEVHGAGRLCEKTGASGGSALQAHRHYGKGQAGGQAH